MKRLKTTPECLWDASSGLSASGIDIAETESGRDAKEEGQKARQNISDMRKGTAESQNHNN